MRRINFIAIAVFLGALAWAPSAGASGLLYSSGPGSDNIAGYTLSGSGKLAPLPASPFTAGDGPGAMTMLPDASALFATNLNTDSVQSFGLQVNKVLKPGVSTPAGNEPAGVALNPAGTMLFVTNNLDATVSIYAVSDAGALTALPTSPQPTVSGPDAVAVSPDGESLYVSQHDGDMTDDVIGAYDIGADGTLTPLAGSPFPAGNEPAAIAIRPNGSTLYAANAGSGTIGSYSIGASGALTELSSSPTPAGAAPLALTLTANGSRLYTANVTGNEVRGFSIGSGGALTAVPGAPTASAGGPVAITATNDGASVFAAPQSANVIRAYDAAGNGALSPAVPATVPTGVTAAATGGTVVAPDQGPLAAFSTSGRSSSRKVKFNATNSIDPDGSIDRYIWDFGDGSTKTTSSPNTKHTYSKNGTYETTLAVSDNVGCSSVVVFTGQMVNCNGSGAAAAASRTVKVKATTFKTKLKVPKKQSQGGKRVEVRLKAGATSGITFTASGKVKAGDKSYKLEGVQKTSSTGKLKRAKLKASKADSRRILARLGKGKTAKAKIKVRFIDNAGRRGTDKATAKLVAK